MTSPGPSNSTRTTPTPTTSGGLARTALVDHAVAKEDLDQAARLSPRYRPGGMMAGATEPGLRDEDSMGSDSGDRGSSATERSCSHTSSTERRVGYRMAAGGKPPVEEEPLVDSPNGPAERASRLHPYGNNAAGGVSPVVRGDAGASGPVDGGPRKDIASGGSARDPVPICVGLLLSWTSQRLAHRQPPRGAPTEVCVTALPGPARRIPGSARTDAARAEPGPLESSATYPLATVRSGCRAGEKKRQGTCAILMSTACSGWSTLPTTRSLAASGSSPGAGRSST